MSTASLRPGAAFKGAMIGGAAAGVVNLSIFFAFGAAGAAYMMDQGGQPMKIPLVMPFASTMMAALAASGVLAALLKFAPQKAWTVFLGVSVLVFLAYGALPVMALDAGDTLGIVSLELMHVVAALGIVGGMRR